MWCSGLIATFTASSSSRSFERLPASDRAANRNNQPIKRARVLASELAASAFDRRPCSTARRPHPPPSPHPPANRSALPERVLHLHQHARVFRRASIARATIVPCSSRDRSERAPRTEQPPPPGAILRLHHFQRARRISSTCERGPQAHLATTAHLHTF